MSSATIRALAPDDAEAAVRLRREALEREPEAFSASIEDDVALSVDFVRRAFAERSQASFGAFAPDLVGMVGVAREPKRKTAHRAQLFGLYVQPSRRNAGAGRALVSAAIGFARQQGGVTQLHLCVAESSRSAVALYASLGFRHWATDPDAMRIEGRPVAVRHLVLALSRVDPEAR